MSGGSDEQQYKGFSQEEYDEIYNFLRFGHSPKCAQEKRKSQKFAFGRKCKDYCLTGDGSALLYLKVTDSKSRKELTDDDAAKAALREPPRRRIVVKGNDVKRVIADVHESLGHLGINNTEAALKETYYWRGIQVPYRTLTLHTDSSFALVHYISGTIRTGRYVRTERAYWRR